MLFRRKPTLKQQYDKKLLALMERKRDQWEQAKRMEDITLDADAETNARFKVAEKKYFYLFKEARIRNLKGRI